MRRWLVRVFLAVSTMIVVAFVAPLAILIKTTAEDRAIDSARADALAVVPALVSGGTNSQIQSAVGVTSSGTAGHMTVVVAGGFIVGPDVESARIDDALAEGASGIGDVAGGLELVIAVSDGSGRLSAVRVFVPDSQLTRGQSAAWLALGLVAALLIGLSVIVADRLARSVVQPTVELAQAAEVLGRGDLDARVSPTGPSELVALGESFNVLGDRISQMLNRERELLAELSHRLRTPLTPLRMKIDRVDDTNLAADLRSDVDELTRVINDLIDEARRGASRIEVIGPCDVSKVVAQRVEFWSVLAEDQGRGWRFNNSTSKSFVAIGEEELTAAVDVLLENVFAHTHEGVRLEVGVERRGSSVTISVADAGSGFDPALISAGRSGSESTGLGLHIARRSAERAGGSLEVKPSNLGGSLVELVLPLAVVV